MQSEDDALEFTVSCSYLEIYNERVRDLLQPPPPAGTTPLEVAASRAGLRVREVRVCVRSLRGWLTTAGSTPSWGRMWKT